MTVVAPGDPREVIKATYAIAERPGPCYLRCGRSGEPIIHQSDPKFEIGKAIMIRKGSDVTLIAIGAILYNAVKAAELLQGKGIDARVLSMHTLKPLDVDAVITAARETNAIITVEEHSIFGGLGSAVAEILAESGNSHVAFKRIAIGDCFCRAVGSHKYLRELYSLSKEGIVKTVESFLKNGKFE
jgi:transketolase